MDFDKLNQRIAILEHRTVVDEIGNHTSKWDEVLLGESQREKLCRTSEYGSHQRNTVRVIRGQAEPFHSVAEFDYA